MYLNNMYISFSMELIPYIVVKCTLTFLLLFAPPLSRASLLDNHVTVLGAVLLHLPEVDVGGFDDVTQTGASLEDLVEVPQQGDKDVAVLRVVEDVALDDLCTVM